MGGSLRSLLLLAVGIIPASPALFASVTQATAPAISFFSTLTESAFATLAAERLEPTTSRHGPFRVPSPGLVARDTTLALSDTRCTADDWARLVSALEKWTGLRSRTELRFVAPDGTVFLLPRVALRSEPLPLVFGTARRLRPDGKTELVRLRLSHDGLDTLSIETSPLSPPPSSAPEETPGNGASVAFPPPFPNDSP